VITVLDAGAFTTIQDLGRPGHAHQGVSAAGAADPLSLRMGNRLVGNEDGAAGLELTLVGGAFRFDQSAIAALTGSNFGAVLESNSGATRPCAPWKRFAIEPGEVLRFGATREGARAYLCVAGGIDAPRTLGSRSTHVATALGGMDGKALRAGQLLPIGTPRSAAVQRLGGSSDSLTSAIFRRTLRFTPGPQADRFPAESRETFRSAEWEVSESADRSGLRLLGPALLPPESDSARTEGVCAGSVQIPGDGRPIILFMDQQTTGGYPKIATVIAAELAAVGQLRPRDRIRFEEVSLGAAREALLEQERLIATLREPA